MPLGWRKIWLVRVEKALSLILARKVGSCGRFYAKAGLGTVVRAEGLEPSWAV